jgi:hypothetical protein
MTRQEHKRFEELPFRARGHHRNLRHRLLGNPMAMSALPIEQALIESC